MLKPGPRSARPRERRQSGRERSSASDPRLRRPDRLRAGRPPPHPAAGAGGRTARAGGRRRSGVAQPGPPGPPRPAAGRGGGRTRDLDVDTAKAAGHLCGATGTADVIDASVVLLAREHRAVVVTSDADDIRASIRGSMSSPADEGRPVHALGSSAWTDVARLARGSCRCRSRTKPRRRSSGQADTLTLRWTALTVRPVVRRGEGDLLVEHQR